jgi:4'-phosphopantetheinyl transferase
VTRIYFLTCEASAVPRGDDWLGPGEAAVAASLRFPKRRPDWRLGRWTAKLALRAHPELGLGEVPLSELEVRAGPGGAPQARRDGVALPCRLSLSHRGDAAVGAVAAGEGPLGCDLERVEERSPAFVEDYFTEGEQAWVRQGGAGDRGKRPRSCGAPRRARSRPWERD